MRRKMRRKVLLKNIITFPILLISRRISMPAFQKASCAPGILDNLWNLSNETCTQLQREVRVVCCQTSIQFCKVRFE